MSMLYKQKRVINSFVIVIQLTAGSPELKANNERKEREFGYNSSLESHKGSASIDISRSPELLLHAFHNVTFTVR